MRKAMGPVLTTGMALVAAAIVVANPVAPPVRDLQISTTQLSTNPEALIPFDKNVLKSMSPSVPSNFSAALAQILGALAAEADRISVGVNSEASTAPIPTAAPSMQVPQVYGPASGDVRSGPVPNGTPTDVATTSPAAAAATTPVFQQVLSDITADTTYLGNKVVEAAYAAVNALVNTPQLIFKAVRSVLIGDLSSALAAVVEAIAAFFDPGLILVGGIDDVVGQHTTHANRLIPSLSAAEVPSSRVVAVPETAVAGTGSTASAPEPTAVAEPGTGKPRDTHSAGDTKRITSQLRQLAQPESADEPQSKSGSSAGTTGTPGSGTPARSVAPGASDSPDQPKRNSGVTRPGSASDGNPGAGGHGASAPD